MRSRASSSSIRHGFFPALVFIGRRKPGSHSIAKLELLALGATAIVFDWGAVPYGKEAFPYGEGVPPGGEGAILLERKPSILKGINCNWEIRKACKIGR